MSQITPRLKSPRVTVLLLDILGVSAMSLFYDVTAVIWNNLEW